MKSFYTLTVLSLAAAVQGSLLQCIVGGDPCPPGSICTQTQTCGGLCVPTATNLPLPPCTVSATPDTCPDGSICTPTMVSPTSGPWGGACLPVPTSINTAPPPELTHPCILGGDPCPTGATCIQTVTCGGLCVASFTPPPQIPCTVSGYAENCPTGSTCAPTMTRPDYGPWGGLCTRKPDPPTPTPTHIPCGGKKPPHCPYGYKCVRKPGKGCGKPRPECQGMCVSKKYYE